MNELEKKFYEYLDGRCLYAGDWQREVANDLAEIAEKDTYGLPYKIEQAYQTIVRLRKDIHKLIEENAELRKILDVRTK